MSAPPSIPAATKTDPSPPDVAATVASLGGGENHEHLLFSDLFAIVRHASLALDHIESAPAGTAQAVLDGLASSPRDRQSRFFGAQAANHAFSRVLSGFRGEPAWPPHALANLTQDEADAAALAEESDRLGEGSLGAFNVTAGLVGTIADTLNQIMKSNAWLARQAKAEAIELDRSSCRPSPARRAASTRV